MKTNQKPNLFRISSDKHEHTPTYVRVKTSYWTNVGAVFQKRSVSVLKRKSKDAFYILEDMQCSDADEFYNRIINIDEVEDGVYEIDVCNEHRDFESGIIDDYDYVLIPVPKEETT